MERGVQINDKLVVTVYDSSDRVCCDKEEMVW